jgi:hypothetical protein
VATVSAHDVTEALTVQLMDATGRTVVATLEVAPAATPQVLQLPVPAGLAGSLQVHVTYAASGRAVGDYRVVRRSRPPNPNRSRTLTGQPWGLGLRRWLWCLQVEVVGASFGLMIELDKPVYKPGQVNRPTLLVCHFLSHCSPANSKPTTTNPFFSSSDS